MKKTKLSALGILLVLVSGFWGLAQEAKVDRVTVPFSDPSKPGMVSISLHNGGVTIKGYNGNEVIVEASTRAKVVKEKKVKGMNLIQINSTGLSVEEFENQMRIKTDSLQRTVDLNIQVPFAVNLKLKAFNNSYIEVEGVSGEIEAQNHNGRIIMNNVSGSVIANSFNGDVKVVLNQITAGKPMSFSTYNGEVDVTLPANLKADVKLNAGRGDILSDFDIALKPAKPAEGGGRDEEGRYRIAFDKTLSGTINGGGPEFSFKNFNGNIVIRKGK